MRGMFDLKTKAGVMLLFLRSVCQLGCFYPSAHPVLKVRTVGNRSAEWGEGQQR